MARQDAYQLVVLCNLIASSIWIMARFETSAALERPYHLSICVLLLSGLFWSSLARRRPASREEALTAEDGDNAYTKLQFEVDDRKYAEALGVRQMLRRFCSQWTKSSFFLAACIVARVILFRSIVQGVECAWDGIEIFLPLLLYLLELPTKDHRTPSISRLDNSTKPTRLYSLRYVLLVAVWALSTYGTISLSAGHSTYICPQGNKLGHTIHLLQCLGLILDAAIIHMISRLSKDAQDTGRPWGLLSQLALTAAGVLSIIACVALWWDPQYLAWSLHLDIKIATNLLFAGLLCLSLIVSAVYLLGELRSTTIVVTASCVCVYTYHFYASNSDFSIIPHRPLVIICLAAFAATLGLIRLEREASKTQQIFSLNQTSSRALMGFCILLSAVFLGKKFMLYSTPSKFSAHPITGLITNARSTSASWQKQAASSTSLKEAVVQYQSRYGVPPPPRFDKWYEYATKRGSIIMDDFGQINHDLLPFWGMRPAEIRNMTGHMLERPWTEVAGLRISNGTTALGPHMAPTHRWMVEGAADMINKFAEWLPDMDLAFNINDESRVAVPWAVIEKLKANAKLSRNQLNKTKTLYSFSTDTLKLWQGSFMDPEPPNAPDVPSEHFIEASLVSSFDQYGIVGCSPDSPSQKYKWWNKRSVCHECLSPHSVGPILANWTLSGSLCHQPDLANLHGFHLSPSAFKPTRMPFPIFSQSKIPTFSDIIFPSPWNYWDKVVHNASRDMPYSEKDRTVFWRGATSEGYGIHGTWQGMQRQRFVHLANYTNPADTVNLLLPNKDNGMGYTQQRTEISKITAITNISVSFVGEPTRCRGPDCDLERLEFNFGPPVDFQDHWKYKFLFDLDGAGFSGRFLPFLESRSLVFRAAGFRQWFDERLTAWRHFVPVDGRLGDVWHLLAYFGGTEKANGHEVEGERIAEEGRMWAGKVLRKEDMEIYMFRLLLEWARIVDDRREELGFVLA